MAEVNRVCGSQDGELVAKRLAKDPQDEQEVFNFVKANFRSLVISPSVIEQIAQYRREFLEHWQQIAHHLFAKPAKPKVDKPLMVGASQTQEASHEHEGTLGAETLQVTVWKQRDLIESVEGFRVKFKHLNGREIRGDKIIEGWMPKRSQDSWTVSYWEKEMSDRFRWGIDIVDWSGASVNGKTLLKNIRRRADLVAYSLVSRPLSC